MDAQPTAEEGIPPAEAEPEPEGEPLGRDGSVPGTETAEETIARLRAERDALRQPAAAAEAGDPPSGEAASPEAAWVSQLRPLLPPQLTLGEIIPGIDDESDTVEFKDTYHSSQNSFRRDNIKEYVLKNVAGFLNSRQGGTLLFGVHDSGKVTGVPFPQATPQDSDPWDLWKRAVSTALGCCGECGGSPENRHKMFASHEIAPSMYKLRRVEVTDMGDPANYAVRTQGPLAGQPAGPVDGQDLYVVALTVQPAPFWDSRLVGDCTTWLVKEDQQGGGAGTYMLYARLESQTKPRGPKGGRALPQAYEICGLPQPTYTIGQTVEAKYTEASTNWKTAKVTSLQRPLGSESYTLNFEGYPNHPVVPSSRIRASGGGGGGGGKGNPTRKCDTCGKIKHRYPVGKFFTKNQWEKQDRGEGNSRCVPCVAKAQEKKCGGGGKGS